MDEPKNEIKTPKDKEERTSRFKRLAEKRTRKIIKSLDLLGNCSNRTNYVYEDAQVELIFNTIKDKLEEVHLRFKRSKDVDFHL